VIRTELFKFPDGHAVAYQEDRQVADDLARRGHLDDVAESKIDLGVGSGDFGPVRPEAHRFGLLLQVGELAAGHLVDVDFAEPARRPVSKGS
jgi:hypothetical protein